MSVQISAPFLDLDKIAVSGQCFRWQRTEDRCYRIPYANECLTIRQSAPGHFSLDCSEEAYDTVWRPYFDLDTDYEAINSRVDPESDPYLYAAMNDQYGVRILRQDTWEMLITSIITQNRNIPAIRRSVELLSFHGGCRKEDKSGNEYYTFPTPEQLVRMSGERLSMCRLGYRAQYVKSAAEAVYSGTLNPEQLRNMSDRECFDRLISLYGVGSKVASCIMLFGLHRLDSFPRDVWINRVLAENYPGGYPFDYYAPYNGVYQQYLFAYSRKTASA